MPLHTLADLLGGSEWLTAKSHLRFANTPRRWSKMKDVGSNMENQRYVYGKH